MTLDRQVVGQSVVYTYVLEPEPKFEDKILKFSYSVSIRMLALYM